MTDETNAAPTGTTAVARHEGGKFVKGVSGNPNGRPKGRGNHLVELQQNLEIAVREHLSVDRIKRIVNRVADMAEGGHMGAAKLIFDKVISNAKNADDTDNSGRTVVFRFENALYGAPKDKTQTQTEVIDVTATEVAPPTKE